MTKSLLQNSFYLVFIGVFTGFIQLNAQTPGGISNTNIKLWIKADSGITNVAGVKQWNDLGPSGKHLVQNTAAARPVYNTATNLMNYNPTVKFDGSDDFMSVTSYTISTIFYHYAIV